ncbi:unnamed protein product [Hymenolepis diminuta]|nr:unnamed protein product [Hymenolepis diminuta]VUZ43361.1 unnamed protein product [Hymenolepis diminuta]
MPICGEHRYHRDCLIEVVAARAATRMATKKASLRIFYKQLGEGGPEQQGSINSDEAELRNVNAAPRRKRNLPDTYPRTYECGKSRERMQLMSTRCRNPSSFYSYLAAKT